MLNVSPYPVIIAVNERKAVEMKPGKRYIYKDLAREKNMAIFAKDKKGRPRQVYKMNINNKNSSRTSVMLYAAKPRRKGQPPIGVYLLTEKTAKFRTLTKLTHAAP